jgi:hypothetical protein
MPVQTRIAATHSTGFEADALHASFKEKITMLAERLA